MNGSCANCFCHLMLCIFYHLLSIFLCLVSYIGRKQRSYNFIMNSGGKVTSVPLKDTLKHYTLHFIAGKFSVFISLVRLICVCSWGLQLPSALSQQKRLRSSLLPGIWNIPGVKAPWSSLESKLWPSFIDGVDDVDIGNWNGIGFNSRFAFNSWWIFELLRACFYLLYLIAVEQQLHQIPWIKTAIHYSACGVFPSCNCV